MTVRTATLAAHSETNMKAIVFAAAVLLSQTAFAQTPPTSAAATPPRPKASRPSIVMLSSYVVTAAVQGLDAHSTFKALDAGAIETNPLLTPLANNRKAFIA